LKLILLGNIIKHVFLDSLSPNDNFDLALRGSVQEEVSYAPFAIFVVILRKVWNAAQTSRVIKTLYLLILTLQANSALVSPPIKYGILLQRIIVP